jgi:phage terminase Nu1 subunit (DNA packaging protein)
MHETEVDAKTLSEFLRLHPRQVLKLAEQGLVVRMSRGKFALIESVANVVSHYRERLAGHTSADGKIDAMKSNALLKEAQRRLVELKYQQLDGQLISLPDIEVLWSDLVRNSRMLFESFPVRARFELQHLSDADQLALERLVGVMLEEMAIKGEAPLPASSKPID